MTLKTVGTPRAPFFVPLLNPLIARLLRMGIPLPPTILLTVRGRKTGRPRTTPVGMFHHAGQRYLFATFGDVNWVRNVRAAGEVTIWRGRCRQTFGAVELPLDQAAVVLKEAVAPYLKLPIFAWVLGPHFATAPHAPLADFIEEARRHPIFALRPVRAEVGNEKGV